ncbi:hypothetical protein [Williamsia muralis]|uniref:Glycosyl transferase family 28 C-terminal domain-containing protein n=1 Tax=Williamsia marianensis TaxID=85044 RepID=A0ABU4ER62_WILMA|nr:hypothetical protein [Williamsia muralis]MDV7133742.1 hypothetical protein [Williamsia muralis]
MIGYYVHHQGHGHRNRAASIARAMRTPVTALSSAPIEPDVFQGVVELDRDDLGERRDVTASGMVHWAPIRNPGMRGRMAQLAAWVEETDPAALVVDVSVEIAVFARLLGVPVIVVAMPGARDDSPHQLAYGLADAIIAPWPDAVYAPDWLRPHLHKTTFTGGISRFAGRARSSDDAERSDVLVMTGSGGTRISEQTVDACRSAYPDMTWRFAGGPDSWLPDPWPAMCSAGVIVGNSGQNTVADLAVAARPAIVIPEDRPFGEQRAVAEMQRVLQLATVASTWPETSAWSALCTAAARTPSHRWSRWETEGAAERAADVIEDVALRWT